MGLVLRMALKKQVKTSVELDNAIQEAKEIVEKCVKCGLCRPHCPVLRILREEPYSPRGKAILIDNKQYGQIVYDCTLCKACEVDCPLDLKLCTAFINVRKYLVGTGKELDNCLEMVKALEKSGNRFGVKEE